MKTITLSNGALVHLYPESEYRPKFNLKSNAAFTARARMHGDDDDTIFDAGDEIHLNATGLLRTLRIPVLGKIDAVHLIGHELTHETEPPGHNHPSNRWPEKRDLKTLWKWIKPILVHAAKYKFSLVSATGLLRWFPLQREEHRVAKEIFAIIRPFLDEVAGEDA